MRLYGPGPLYYVCQFDQHTLTVDKKVRVEKITYVTTHEVSVHPQHMTHISGHDHSQSRPPYSTHHSEFRQSVKCQAGS